jgi:hypothetical protein
MENGHKKLSDEVSMEAENHIIAETNAKSELEVSCVEKQEIYAVHMCVLQII